MLADAGAARLVREADLTAEGLAALVRELLHDPARLATMARRAAALAIPDAADRLVDLVLALAGREPA